MVELISLIAIQLFTGEKLMATNLFKMFREKIKEHIDTVKTEDLTADSFPPMIGLAHENGCTHTNTTHTNGSTRSEENDDLDSIFEIGNGPRR